MKLGLQFNLESDSSEEFAQIPTQDNQPAIQSPLKHLQDQQNNLSSIPEGLADSESKDDFNFYQYAAGDPGNTLKPSQPTPRRDEERQQEQRDFHLRRESFNPELYNQIQFKPQTTAANNPSIQTHQNQQNFDSPFNHLLSSGSQQHQSSKYCLEMAQQDSGSQPRINTAACKQTADFKQLKFLTHTQKTEQSGSSAGKNSFGLANKGQQQHIEAESDGLDDLIRERARKLQEQLHSGLTEIEEVSYQGLSYDQSCLVGIQQQQQLQQQSKQTVASKNFYQFQKPEMDTIDSELLDKKTAGYGCQANVMTQGAQSNNQQEKENQYPYNQNPQQQQFIDYLQNAHSVAAQHQNQYQSQKQQQYSDLRLNFYEHHIPDTSYKQQELPSADTQNRPMSPFTKFLTEMNKNINQDLLRPTTGVSNNYMQTLDQFTSIEKELQKQAEVDKEISRMHSHANIVQKQNKFDSELDQWMQRGKPQNNNWLAQTPTNLHNNNGDKTNNLTKQEEDDLSMGISASFYSKNDLSRAKPKLSLLKRKIETGNNSTVNSTIQNHKKSQKVLSNQSDDVMLVPLEPAPQPKHQSSAVQSVNIQNQFNLNNLQVLSRPEIIKPSESIGVTKMPIAQKRVASVVNRGQQKSAQSLRQGVAQKLDKSQLEKTREIENKEAPHKLPKWKQQSLDFRRQFSAKQKLSDVMKEDDNSVLGLQKPHDDRTFCEHCKRGFNEDAYKRHLPRCERQAKEMLMRNKFRDQQMASQAALEKQNSQIALKNQEKSKSVEKQQTTQGTKRQKSAVTRSVNNITNSQPKPVRPVKEEAKNASMSKELQKAIKGNATVVKRKTEQ